MADKVMLYKYIIKNVAKKYDKTVTTMPKPLFGDNGSGMHTHISIWKGGEPLVRRQRLCRTERHGPVRHRRHSQARPGAVRHLQPHDQQLQAFGPRLRSPGEPGLFAAEPLGGSIRIPMYSPNPKAKRLEYRCPDPSCNPYLSFSAILMAAIDGIQNKIDPGEPLDKDIYDLSPEEMKGIPTTPGSLDEALDGACRPTTSSCSAATCSRQDVIDTWIWYKTANEVDAVRLRPHPYEFCLYYDI